MRDDAPTLTWITDSGQVESIHRNGVSLSMVDSYIGHLDLSIAGEVYSFTAVLRDGTRGATQSLGRARAELYRLAMAIIEKGNG